MRQTQTFMVLERYVPYIQEHLGKLTTKAMKLGISAPEITHIGEKKLLPVSTYLHRKGTPYAADEKMDNLVPVVPITIEAETLVIQGWQVVAKLEKTPAGMLVKQVGGVDTPLEYWDTATTCDHCNMNRQRKHVWLLHKEGEFKRVGHTCLADFTRDVNDGLLSKILFRGNLFHTISEYIDDLDNWGTGGSGYLDAKAYLSICVAYIDKYGFIPSADGGATWRDAAKHYYCRCDNPLEITDSHKETADAVINWAMSLKDDSMYLHNVRVALSSPSISEAECGLVASAAHVWKKEMTRKEESSELNKYPPYNIGDTVESTLIKSRVNSYPSEYGLMFVYIFRDEEGHVYVWKTQSSFEENQARCRFRVKKFNEYNGKRQTIITHVKVIL